MAPTGRPRGRQDRASAQGIWKLCEVPERSRPTREARWHKEICPEVLTNRPKDKNNMM